MKTTVSRRDHQPHLANPAKNKYFKFDALFVRAVILFSFASFLFAGCALFTPRDFSKYKEGQWAGKVLIRDKKSGHSGIVNLSIKAIDQEKLRIDVTSPIGAHIASILMLGNKFEYLSVDDKTVFKMTANQQSLRSLLHVPLDPAIFYNILFDHHIVSKNWSCVATSKGSPQSCAELKTKLSINWGKREGAKRTIEILHPDATVQMNIYDFNSHISEPEKAFTLKIPSSFKVKTM